MKLVAVSKNNDGINCDISVGGVLGSKKELIFLEKS